MTGTVLLILAVVGCVVLLLFGRRDKARRIGLDDPRATARQRMEAADPNLPDSERAEIGRLLAAGRKLEAIRRVHEKTGLDLKAAKEFVEHNDFPSAASAASPAAQARPRAAEQERRPNAGPWGAEESTAPVPGPGLSSVDLVDVARALAAGRKIEAIKLVREKTGMGLKEAKDFVEGPAFDVAGKR
jgi:ribosomal protein L7/L12